MTIRRLLHLAVLAALFALPACEDHFTTQDAYDVCDQLVERNPATNPPDTFLDCVACYETCGNSCTLGADGAYGCPDEEAAGGSDQGGAGGGE